MVGLDLSLSGVQRRPFKFARDPDVRSPTAKRNKSLANRSKFHAKIAVANSIYDTSLQGFPEPLVGYGFDSIIQPSTPPINITIKSIISKMAFPACQYSLPIRPVGKLAASWRPRLAKLRNHNSRRIFSKS